VEVTGVMNRLTAIICVCVVASCAVGQAQRPQVTGTLELPPGATLPANVKIEVDIYKVEPGQVITFLKRVGREEMKTVKSTPVTFAVPYPPTVLKDTPPKSFVLRASVYELPKAGGSKLVYQTPEKEMPEAFTAAGEPRQNVRLAVKAVQSK
jgi:type III secretion system (T3SS) chaperone YscW